MIQHDGPIWSVAAAESDGHLALALGGVEDRPLDRSDGTFGNVDSFLFLYRIDELRGIARAERVAAINLGELGVILPKWVGLAPRRGGGLTVTATGYGGGQLAEIAWPPGAAPVVIARRAVPPGITAMVPGAEGAPALAADPLLDAWLAIGPGDDPRVTQHPVAPLPAAPPRSLESRIGELLAFTELMAPWAPAAGKASRFTCETCHFEGGIDGRVHFTGRGQVHATTRPLFGLFANRPHFTRALDRTMAEMVENEFRVATRSSGRDPWFAVARDDVPWLAAVAGLPTVLDPVLLRRSLIAFLVDLEPEPSRAAAGRNQLDARERRGAELFRDRCATCHPARRVTDRAASEIPFADWPAAIFAGGAITWARDGYERTGIEPYVHEAGARPSSLRRVARKQPYFTDGSAATLEEVLARASWGKASFRHGGAPPADATTLGPAERDALRAFLELL
jgi:hypothetical protein